MGSSRRYRIRTGARTTSKVLEKELIKKARRLTKNPELALPKCIGNCKKCPFEKTRRQIDRVAAMSDDPKMLQKFSNRGDQIARAYAGTIGLAHAEKVPFLAVLRTPMGEVPYALRGKAKKEKLAGMQHYDDPKWRLLIVLEEVQKYKLHVYSTKEAMYCTGHSPEPPKEFVKEAIGGLRIRLRYGDRIHHCDHLTPQGVKKKRAFSEPYMRIKWESANITIAACRRCLSSNKGHTLAQLTQRVAAVNALDDFTLEVISRPDCAGKCSECLIKQSPGVDEELFERYSKGEIADQEFITEHMSNVLQVYKNLSKKLYIGENKCYGTNIKRFIRALKPSDEEASALKAVLKAIPDTVVVDKMTPNRVFMTYWKSHGKKALLAATGDKEVANAVYKEFDVNKNPPSQIIKEALFRVKHKNILRVLPSYDKLPPVVEFADEIARIYMTKDEEEAVRAVDKYRGGDTNVKSVAFAILLVFDKAASKKWQYTKTETDSGEFLMGPVKELLNAEPEQYHDKLQALLSATGSTQVITPI